MQKNNRGSLTLEASIVLPIFLIALISLFFILEMIKCYEDVEVNLYKASKEMALYIEGTDVVTSISDNVISDAILSVLSGSYAKEIMDRQLTEDGGSTHVIKGGIGSMSYLYSNVRLRDKAFLVSNSGTTLDTASNTDLVDLVVTYEMEPLLNLFNVAPYKMVNRCRMHPWTGYDSGSGADKSGERIVYVTESGTVYHLSKSCSHIQLSISPVNYSQLESSRNSEGGKYKLCEICGDIFSDKNGVVFITSEGDRYHSSLNCSGLKRTVSAIPISQVGDKKACSRCSQAK